MRYYEIFRSEFPDARIKASTFDDYMISLSTIKDKLPVVTNEIGDTWIQGIASDPRKMAEYRAVSRVLGNCIKKGSVHNFCFMSRFLFCVCLKLT